MLEEELRRKAQQWAEIGERHPAYRDAELVEQGFELTRIRTFTKEIEPR